MSHSVKTKGSHATTATTTTTTLADVLPQYRTYQNRCNKSIINGRDPRSFRRKSELWVNVENSTNRLDSVAKGKSFWNVIESDDYSMYSNDGSTATATTDSTAAYRRTSMAMQVAKKLNSNSSCSGSGSGIFKQVEQEKAIPKRSLTVTTINSVPVDMAKNIEILFGMKIVIMNISEEILCVTLDHSIKVKPKKQLLCSDKVVFRIVDLDHYDNNGSIPFGVDANVWLQVVDTINDKSEQLWNNGYLLGSKLYHSPATDTLNMSEVVLQGKVIDADIGAAEEERKQQELALVSKKEIEKGIGSSLRVRRKNMTLNKALPIHKTIDNGNASTTGGTDGVASEAKDAVSDDEEEVITTPIKKEASFVCGGVSYIRLVETRKVKVNGGFGVDEIPLKTFSKQSYNLGKFYVFSGEQKTSKKLYSNKVYSQKPVCFCQDLYCLASSAGSGYTPWPLMSDVIYDRMGGDAVSFDANYDGSSRSDYSSGNNGGSSDGSISMTGNKPNINEIRDAVSGVFGQGVQEHSKSDNKPSAAAPSTNGSSNSSSNSSSSSSSSNTNVKQETYGCIRRIDVQKPPFEYTLDRKCVWLLAPVDVHEEQAAYSKSSFDNAVQILQSSAKRNLKISEKHRKGDHEYKDIVYRDTNPLHSGEAFSTMIRAISSDNLLLSEAKHMLDRRSKERNVTSYFQSKMVEIDRSTISVHNSSNSRSSNKQPRLAIREYDDSDTVSAYSSLNQDDDNMSIGSSYGASRRTNKFFSPVKRLVPLHELYNKKSSDSSSSSIPTCQPSSSSLPSCQDGLNGAEMLYALHNTFNSVEANIIDSVSEAGYTHGTEQGGVIKSKKIAIDESVLAQRLKKLQESDNTLSTLKKYREHKLEMEELANFSLLDSTW